LESLYGQTAIPEEVVLVVDGAVGSDQEAVIARYSSDRRIDRLEIVRTGQCRGMALALNAGISPSAGTFIARMDSDDICFAERFAEQWEVVRRHPEVDVVGSWSAEFRDDPKVFTGLKTPPEEHEQIIRALTFRNVLVHPSILVRKEMVER